MELALSIGLGGWVILVSAAVLFGGTAQYIGDARAGYEWLVDAIAFGIGAIVASEFVIGWQTFEPVVDGLALVPALLGGLAVGVITEVVIRFATGGSYAHAAA